MADDPQEFFLLRIRTRTSSRYGGIRFVAAEEEEGEDMMMRTHGSKGDSLI